LSSVEIKIGERLKLLDLAILVFLLSLFLSEFDLTTLASSAKSFSEKRMDFISIYKLSLYLNVIGKKYLV
jgi:hypothetical protein